MTDKYIPERVAKIGAQHQAIRAEHDTFIQKYMPDALPFAVFVFVMGVASMIWSGDGLHEAVAATTLGAVGTFTSMVSRSRRRVLFEQGRKLDEELKEAGWRYSSHTGQFTKQNGET